MESGQQQDEETTPSSTLLEQEDNAFARYFGYAYLATALIVLVLSLVLLLGLLIPLLIQLKNGTFHQNYSSQRRRQTKEPPYSTYNLYLVYLALADLAYVVPTIAADFCSLTQKYDPRFYSMSVYMFMDDPPPIFHTDSGTPPPLHFYLHIPYVFFGRR